MADWDHVQEKWDYFSPRIQALATVESKQRPALDQVLQNQASKLKAIDDGKHLPLLSTILGLLTPVSASPVLIL